MQNHYKTLGTYKAATDEQVRVAYGLMARKCHPDLFSNNEKKAAQMADLNVAYNVLKNVKQRKAYDRQLELSGRACTNCGGKGAVAKQRGFVKKTYEGCGECDGSGVAS